MFKMVLLSVLWLISVLLLLYWQTSVYTATLEAGKKISLPVSWFIKKFINCNKCTWY